MTDEELKQLVAANAKAIGELRESINELRASMRESNAELRESIAELRASTGDMRASINSVRDIVANSIAWYRLYRSLYTKLPIWSRPIS